VRVFRVNTLGTCSRKQSRRVSKDFVRRRQIKLRYFPAAKIRYRNADKQPRRLARLRTLMTLMPVTGAPALRRASSSPGQE